MEHKGHGPVAPAAPRKRRPRTTSPRVRWVNRAATSVITFGGIGVILAVMGILVYLVVVVRPLFVGASLSSEASYPLLAPGEADRIIYASVDEYRALGVCVLSTGDIVSFSAHTGEVLERRPLFPEAPAPTAASAPAHGGQIAFGFPDGTVRLADISFTSSFLGRSGQDDAAAGVGVVQRLPSGESRSVAVDISVEDPFEIGTPGRPVLLLDYRASDNQSMLAALKEGGEMVVDKVTSRTNLLTGRITRDISSTPITVPAGIGEGTAAFLRITARGDQAYLAWRDGSTLRFDLRDLSSPVIAESSDLTPETGVAITALRFMNGDQSILVSDSSGLTRAWFLVARPGTGEDGHRLVAAHTLEGHPAPVEAIAVSTRDKTLATGDDDGGILLHHLTSDRTLAAARLSPPSAVRALQLTPKGDGLFAIGADGTARLWNLSNPHPETSIGSLFGEVWYEGYPEPAFTWQSSSGTDDFEPKLSLIPLVFGTLKATIYSMLFAVPIALFAAIYTSEFLDPRYRAPLKSTIEMMASLPSVVLGFIAALVLAPLVESWVIAVLLVFGVAPLAALAAGYLWQTLPHRVAARFSGRPQFLFLILVVILSVLLAARLAGPFETMMFHGNFKAWLDGRVGTGAPGLVLLAWPPIVVSLLVADRRYFAAALHRRLSSMPPAGEAAFDLAKYAALLIASAGLAWAFALIGEAMGFDPRGHLLGTYVQRNALVVGFVMGFAVIPIIYTIADDALSAVPRTLRSASLGCGATRWQTATRIVLPVAVPGIFSALMVGLGRAVGETMIVLMAAGNTPLMDMNLFNGLRTLSANIAVELPEAVKDGTLYRVLFLSALLLFLVTFVVNTLAEMVRQRFRKKAYQL